MRLRVGLVALALLAAPAASARADSSTATPWQPDVAAATQFAQARYGDIAFAVRTDQGYWSYRATHTFPCASVIKAMALVAYLDHPSVRDRALTQHDKDLLTPMIRRSDDNATSQVVRYVRAWRIRALANRVGMTNFTYGRTLPGTHYWSPTSWGRSSIDAEDQSRYMLHIDDDIDGAHAADHRAFALKLLRTVIPSQRWGIATVQPMGWTLYFKGGWGSGTGWVDHQVALLTRNGQRVSVVILTHNDGSHAYGKATLRGIALRLLKGLDSAQTLD